MNGAKHSSKMWGGKREGSGRKSRGRCVVLSLRILPEYAERIRVEAEQQGVPTGEIVERYMNEKEVAK